MPKPLFTLITPTLQRQSLLDTCRSIDEQTYTGWNHIVMVDCAEFDIELLKQIEHADRRIVKCPKPHINGGNTCRHDAWEHATGSHLIYVDDDNTLSDNRVLEDMAEVLSSAVEPWSIFPVTRLGGRFYTDPPRACHVDTLNLVLRKEVARWPDTNAYGSDGILVDDLMTRGVPYAAFPEFRPIGIIPKISFCKPD